MLPANNSEAGNDSRIRPILAALDLVFLALRLLA